MGAWERQAAATAGAATAEAATAEFTALAAALAILSAMFLYTRRVYKRNLHKLHVTNDALKFVYRLKRAKQWREAAEAARGGAARDDADAASQGDAS